MLESAHCLRRAIQRALHLEIAELFDADCDDDVPEELLEHQVPALTPEAPERLRKAMASLPARLRGRELENLALRLWRRKGRYRHQTLMPNEYAAFLHPSKSSASSS